MKRICALILCAIVLLSMCGCKEEAPVIEDPADFYYRCAAAESSIPEQIIAPIAVEVKGQREDTVALLNFYLRGTANEGFDVTFPASTKVLSLTYTEDTAFVNLNASLARLSGIDLTIACACITLTTIGLTGVSKVAISAANETLDGAEQITMDASCLTLLDTVTPETNE